MGNRYNTERVIIKMGKKISKKNQEKIEHLEKRITAMRDRGIIVSTLGSMYKVREVFEYWLSEEGPYGTNEKIGKISLQDRINIAVHAQHVLAELNKELVEVNSDLKGEIVKRNVKKALIQWYVAHAEEKIPERVRLYSR